MIKHCIREGCERVAAHVMMMEMRKGMECELKNEGWERELSLVRGLNKSDEID